MGATLARGDWPAEFLASLLEILGPHGVRGREAIAALDPGMHRANLDATLMARPASATQAARVLALCARAGVGVVPQGGRTGLAGGAQSGPDELIVSLDRMNRIEQLDPLSRTATVEAGVTLARLEAAAAPHGLSAGIDLGAAKARIRAMHGRKPEILAWAEAYTNNSCKAVVKFDPA